MPLLSSSAGLSARALGLTSGIVAGPPTINSIDIFNGLNGNRLLVYFTPGTPGSSPITNYEYSLNNGSTYTPFSLPQNSSPLVIEGLTNGTTYTVKIRSLQGNQRSVASNAVSGRPVALPITPLPQLYFNDAGGTGGGAVLVYFSPSSAGTDPIVNYQFSLDWANPNGWRFVNSITSPIVISNTMGYGTILVNGTSYPRFSLRAVTSSGHFSDYVTTTQGVRPVRSPGAPTISGITASTGQISIAFSAGISGTDALSTYQYSLNNGSTWTNRATGTTASPLVVTGITDSSVVNGSYTVRIRSATNQGHFSSQSNAVVPAPTPAAAPVIGASSKTPTSITMTFTSAVAGSYAIDRHERSLDGTNWTTYTSGTEITGLSTSTEYTVRIRAVDVQSVNGEQASTDITTDAEVAPNAPTIGVTEELTTTSIRVNFTAGTAGTYAIGSHERQVYYYFNGWVLHSDWTAATSPFDVTGLPYADYSYLVRVRSKSTTQLAGAYSEVWVKTKASTPSAPTLSFSATSASERATASLSWDAPTYATKYNVYMNGVYQKQVTTTTTTLAVSAGGTYNFKVTAGNRHDGFSGDSNTKTMVTGEYLKDATWLGQQTERMVIKTDSPPAGCSAPVRFSITVYGSTDDAATAGYARVDTVSAAFRCGVKPAFGTTDYAEGQAADRTPLCNPSNLRLRYGFYDANAWGGTFGSAWGTRTHSTGGSSAYFFGNGSITFTINAVAGKQLNSNCTVNYLGDYWLVKEFTATGKVTTATTYS